MRQTIEITAIAADDGLSLDDLCRLSAVSPQWLQERLEAGLLAAAQNEAAAWRFDAAAVHRVRVMSRLERDFDAVPELAALVADLQAEIDRLRRQLRRAGLG
jgi:chaperone modulatory protein CbpM